MRDVKRYVVSLAMMLVVSVVALIIFSARKIKEKTAAKKTIEERW